MKIDWRNKWFEFDKGGKPVKLQVQEEKTLIQMCEGVELDKELKANSSVIVA